MNEILKALGGKKSFWVLLIVLLTVFKDKIGIDTETIKWIAGSVGLIGLGQGYADGQSGGATSHAPGDDK